MKSKQPLVSVIIPNYNHARFLDQRIQTVLNQTYRNIEVIILDDCSTDNSLEVIGKYKSDSRIVHVVANEQNSCNTFLQWEKGLRLANGELVWIAESDDYCELDLLEDLVNSYIYHKNIVLAYTSSVFVDEEGNVLYPIKQRRTRILKGSSFLKRYLSLANFVYNASSAIFSRELALSISRQYQTMKGAGDYMFWVEMASHGNIAIVRSGLNYFRRSKGVVTKRLSENGQNLFDEMRVYKRLCSFVRISRIRDQHARAFRANIIYGGKYDTEEIRQQLLDTWVGGRMSRLQHSILRITEHFRVRYDIYL